MREILDEKKNKAHATIACLADDLRDTLIEPSVDTTEILRDQAKILHYLTMQMIAEATPKGQAHSMFHNRERLSLALRAQNQFCRTVMAMDYLDEKQKNANELSNTDISS